MAFISGLHTVFPRLFLYCSESAQPQASLLINGASWQIYCWIEFLTYLFHICLSRCWQFWLFHDLLVIYLLLLSRQKHVMKGPLNCPKCDAVCKKVPGNIRCQRNGTPGKTGSWPHHHHLWQDTPLGLCFSRSGSAESVDGPFIQGWFSPCKVEHTPTGDRSSLGLREDT